MASFIIWGKFKIVLLKSQSPQEHKISLSKVFSENLSFLFLDEFIYIISEDIFYKYRKRERGKESSSFLPHKPKRVGMGGPRVQGMGQDAERWGLGSGNASPCAALISLSVLLIHPSKPAQGPAHCCHLQLCRELSWETSCVLATACSSGHCRAALPPSHLPFVLMLISAVVAQSLCQPELCLYPFPSELRDPCFGTSPWTALAKREGRSGAALQCCSAQGLVAADEDLQVPLHLGLHQGSTRPFAQHWSPSAAGGCWLRVVQACLGHDELLSFSVGL